MAKASSFSRFTRGVKHTVKAFASTKLSEERHVRRVDGDVGERAPIASHEEVQQLRASASKARGHGYAGLGRIVYGQFYRDERIFDFAKRLGIELTDLSAMFAPKA